MTSEKLRQLPPVFEVVAQLRAQRPHVPDTRLTQAARDGINHLRTEILNDPSIKIELQSILEYATLSLDRSYAPVEVINATGVVLHTNLGRAPLSRRAIDAVINAAQSSDLEYDLEAGKRASRNRLLSKPLAELTQTEAGFIVNNCAAALILALAGLGGRAAALARSQIIEIGGGFRLPDIMRVSGVNLHEVGTTNRTRLSDYEEALEQGAESILWMHRSNFELTGFTEEPSLAELSKLATKHEVPLIYDLGTGLLWDTDKFNLRAEPTIQDKTVQLADVTLFSGDKLFGGPQAGIIVGNRVSIEKLMKHPFARALRADKLTTAALAATLESHLAESPDDLPVYQMLTMSRAQLVERANTLASHLDEGHFNIIDITDTVGGGTMPNSELPGLALELKTDSPEQLHAALRASPLPIVTRIQEKAVLVHVRTITPSQIENTAHKLAKVLATQS